jgi:hypothetical protein
MSVSYETQIQSESRKAITNSVGSSIDETNRGRTPAVNSYLAIGFVLAIVILGAYLRYANLWANPGWHGNEGYNINIAWNLAQGRLQMYATSFAFVQHPPLFYALLAPFMWVLGPDILALRLLSGTFGVLTTGALYILGRSLGSQKIGIFAAGIFAIYPVAVIYNRWGYTYNQLMFLAVVTAILAWRGLESVGKGSRWWLAAGFSAGLGMISDQEGVFLIFSVLTCAFVVDRRIFVPTLLAALGPPTIYAAVMMSIMPSEFIYDWQHNLGRVSDVSPLVAMMRMALHYERFLAFDYWLPLGLVGVFLIPNTKARWMCALFVLAGLLLIVKVRNPNPYFRTAIPLLPFVVLGMAVLMSKATEYLFRWWSECWVEVLGQRWRGARSLAVMFGIFLVLYLPVTITFAVDISGVQNKLLTAPEELVANNADDAKLMAVFVNANADQNDMVIVSSHVAWLLKTRTADLLQAVVATGQGTAFYPDGLPASRFVYDPRYENAKYVVVDDFSRVWAGEMPAEGRILHHVTTNWPAVFVSGEYTVYENPKDK